MSNPRDLVIVREAIQDVLDLSDNELGIEGDSSHRGGYHLGRDRLRTNGRLWWDYSVSTKRDQKGLSNSASALDIGYWDGLKEFSSKLVELCMHKYVCTEWVREVIWFDGYRVRRYDAAGLLDDDGDSSHRRHTHISFWRDTEGVRAPIADVFVNIIRGKHDSKGVEHMFLVRVQERPEVFLSDGVSCRWVSAQEIAEIQRLMVAGVIPCQTAEVKAVENMSVIGMIKGPVPEGYEGYSEAAYMPACNNDTNVVSIVRDELAKLRIVTA